MNPKTVHKISYGLYVVCSRKENKPASPSGRLNGQIANTVFQITSQPPTIAVSINKQNLTHEFIQASKVFTVSVLTQDTPMEFIGRFGFKSGRDIDKLAGVNHQFGQTKAPIVTDYTLAYLEAKLTKELDVGTHTIFVGEVVGAEIIKETEPMTYAYYHQVKRGKAPKTAPTYIKEDESIKTSPKAKGDKTDKYWCTVCSYVYDPAQGDPDAGIKPGTAFEDLPNDWICPVCGVGKDKFERKED